jgi:hypothetical protein
MFQLPTSTQAYHHEQNQITESAQCMSQCCCQISHRFCSYPMNWMSSLRSFYSCNITKRLHIGWFGKWLTPSFNQFCSHMLIFSPLPMLHLHPPWKTNLIITSLPAWDRWTAPRVDLSPNSIFYEFKGSFFYFYQSWKVGQGTPVPRVTPRRLAIFLRVSVGTYLLQ